MSSRGVKQSAQLPAVPVDATPPARVGKRGALSVPRLGKGSNAVPAPVQSIKFEAQGRAKAPIEFVVGGPMRPFRRSRAPRLTAAISTSDEEEDTGQFTSPFLLLLSVLIPLNYFRQKFHCANATILILPLIGSRDRSGEL